MAECRQIGLGVAGGLDWRAVQSVLELYGLWTVDVHHKLRICISELLAIEAEQRQRGVS